MPLFHLFILAIVQGLTEFLPVSSSGHLVLAHEVMGSRGLDADRALDVAVHVGTLFAVLLYFRRDFIGMADRNAVIRNDLPAQPLRLILLASLPVLALGGLFYLFDIERYLRTPEVIGWAFVIFGIVLWWADAKRPQNLPLTSLRLKGAMAIGAAQMLALIPGTSRSGITMTAARYLGLSRTDSARFSLYLGAVAIAAAGALGALDLLLSGNLSLGLDALFAMGFAFVAGYAAIAVMMRWLMTASFLPFVIYRIALGVVILGLAYSGVL